MAITRSPARRPMQAKSVASKKSRRPGDVDEAAATQSRGVAAQRRRRRPSTHNTRTRSDARVFRFFDLPGEIKNMIYRIAFTGQDTALHQLRLPRALQVPQILTEARAFVFECTPLVIKVLTNVCVRYQHLHTAGNVHFNESDLLDWPPAVTSRPRQHVRFRKITLEGLCCCCRNPGVIMRLKFEVVAVSEEEAAGQLKLRLVLSEVVNRASTYERVVESLDRIISTAEDCVRSINGRQRFIGLSRQDVEELALCFRDPSEDDGHHDSGSE